MDLGSRWVSGLAAEGRSVTPGWCQYFNCGRYIRRLSHTTADIDRALTACEGVLMALVGFLRRKVFGGPKRG